MTALDLYKFLEQQSDSPQWDGDALIVWICDISGFVELIGYEYLSEGGINVNLRGTGTIALDIVSLCEDFDIDPEQLYEKEK